MYSEEFYQSIGHAFYTVTHADEELNKGELRTLIKVVRNEWDFLP